MFDSNSRSRRNPRQQPQQQRQQTQPEAPPPPPPAASKHFRDNLPLAQVTADDLVLDLNNKECVICFDEHIIGQTACKLPCGHIFHPECLKDWLAKQASCPICRYEVETDDSSFEYNRKKRMRERKLRYRKDELMSKSIKELREMLDLYFLGTRGCVDKRDMVERLIASGKVDIIEGVPTMDITREELGDMSIGDVKRLLLDFGLTGSVQYRNALEKRELIQCLLDSDRVNLKASASVVHNDDIHVDDWKSDMKVEVVRDEEVKIMDEEVDNKCSEEKYSNERSHEDKGDDEKKCDNDDYKKSHKEEKCSDDKHMDEILEESWVDIGVLEEDCGQASMSTSTYCETYCETNISVSTSTSSATANHDESKTEEGLSPNPWDSWTMKELMRHARSMGVSLNGCLERVDVVNAIQNHQMAGS